MIQPNELMSLRTLRLIASSRAILAGSLCLSVILSRPIFPALATISGLLVAYLVFTVAAWVTLHRKEAAYWLLNRSLALQVTDTVVLSVLVYLTGGADSPFFPALSLLTVIATIQWGSRGAIVMGVLVVLVYLPTGILTVLGDEHDKEALPHFISRLIAISVNTLLLTVLGSHFERIVRQMARPSQAFPDSDAGAAPPIVEALEHAIGLIGADRGVLLWQESDEPHATLVFIAEGETRQSRILLTEEAMGAEWEDDVFLLSLDRTAFVQRGSRIEIADACPMSADVTRRIPFSRTLAIRARAATGECWIFVPDDGDQANEELQIGRFIATQVSLALTKWHSERMRLDLHGREERLRVGRGLHDGVLQFLAGTSLQLSAISQKLDKGSKARGRIDDLLAALREEQREVRALVSAIDEPRAMPGTLAEDVRGLAVRLGKQWAVRVTGEVAPEDLAVPDALRPDILHMMREAVANAVRHGHASRVTIQVSGADDTLTLAVADDGRGFDVHGTRGIDAQGVAEGAPKSITARTQALGGTITIDSEATGATITAVIPYEALAGILA